VRRASEDERARLNETFAALCGIPSPSGDEGACAGEVTRRLRALDLEVSEDGAAALTGAGAGNLLATISPRAGARADVAPPPSAPARSVLLCAHLDTVGHRGPIEPVMQDGAWSNRYADILGADNKAAVAVLLELARRCVHEPPPVAVELLFTVSEERSLAGALAFDASRLSSDIGYVFDHASPIGEVVMASPTHYRIDASFRGSAAHAGLRPEDGRSAILAAAHAVAALRLGRLDEQTTANVGLIEGGAPSATNVVAERCHFEAEARSLDPVRVEALVAEMVDHIHDAANVPAWACDVDVGVRRTFSGYHSSPRSAAVSCAQTALRGCGHEPRGVLSGGASDANALVAAGVDCVNLANGTEHNHQPDERVSVAALEDMLDVALALLDAAAVSEH